MSRVRISFPAPHKKRIGFTPIRFFVLRGKRVVANSQVRVTEQSLIAREYAEGFPCAKATQLFLHKGNGIISFYIFCSGKFACRLHIAIDIRRGSRKIAETILRTETALSRFMPIRFFVLRGKRVVANSQVRVSIAYSNRHTPRFPQNCRNNFAKGYGVISLYIFCGRKFA